MTDKDNKKLKIWNLAKELNISSDSIIDFLSKKGVKVKNYLTIVEEEYQEELYSHFRKEKTSAELHTKKIAQIEEKKKKVVLTVESKTTTTSQLSPLERMRAKKTLTIKKTVELKPESKTQNIESKIVNAAEEVNKQDAILAKTAEQNQNVAIQTPGEAKTEIASGDVLKNKTTQYVSAKDTALKAKKFNLVIKGKVELETKSEKQQPKKGEIKATDDASKKKKKKKIVKTHRTEAGVNTNYDTSALHKPRLKPGEQNDKSRIREELAPQATSTIPSYRATLRKIKKKKREEVIEKQKEVEAQREQILKVTEYLTVGNLASLMNIPVGEVIAKCMNLGLMVSINQRIEKDNIILVASDFGYEIEFVTEFVDDSLSDSEDAVETLETRPPIITVMGHVDHGKTSLLDYLRKTTVAKGESGGITQHIGAYQVNIPNKGKVTFLDTPGHEAFTAMRARGAELTDIVVLVVAAEDNVMPQTIEAISHAKAANVPIIIAINKIDKPEANPERIKQQLADRDVLVEEWGGKYQSVELSARTGKNIDLLLEKILLEAEILDLKANPKRIARSVVVEAKLDKGKGIIGTVLVQKGTLKIGDPFIAGIYSGKVKAMMDEEANLVKFAGPSTPVQVLGFDGMPTAGDSLIVVEDDKFAREISTRRQQIKREQDFRQIQFTTLDDIAKQIKEGKEVRDLAIIVKGDVDGSVEALADTLLKLSTDEVKIRVIHKAVGAISESDVLLASTSRAIIIGFHVRPNLNARKLADVKKVDIRYHTIIYNAISEVKLALEGLLAPTLSEEVTSTVEIRDVFKIPKIGTVAGCYLTDGSITRNDKVRLLRDGITIFDGSILALKRFKDDVREVQQGFECGISLEGFNDVKIGDIIESYKIVETKRKLS